MTTQAQQIQDMEEQLNWHWRNSMKVVRFFNFDARAAWPLPLLLLYARPSTLVITIINLYIFRFLEQKRPYISGSNAGCAYVSCCFFL